jgi:class 3 adenylate cyclase/tetratricopeptide (TPR) repeat protein
MRCTGCDADNPETARFCSACGAALPVKCGACGQPNRAGSRFCNQCGGALTAAANHKAAPSPAEIAVGHAAPAGFVPEGERKLVTALFVDIINSTGLEQDLDPEEARAIVDPALRLMIDAVRRYDGYVVQSTGDGIFALFGAPVAHEDHPQRSLYAALRLQDEIRRLSDRLRTEGRRPIQIRAGVNTGEVVVRPIRTGERQTEYTPIGHTVNLASRMQSLANADAIVISDATRSLVEGYFTLRSLGPARLKGISDAVRVYEVAGLGPLRTRLERSAGRGLSKFVGREKEREVFRKTAGIAKSGSGQIVALVAEPGVGKSRLFFEFKAEMNGDWKVLEAYAVSHGKGSAYLPVIELLHGYFGIAKSDDAATRRAKLAQSIAALDPAMEASLPYLNALLEIEDNKERLAGMDPQLRRARTFDAVVKLLLAEAMRNPLVLIIEDLHWLDDESQALLDLLVEQMAGASLLLLVNFRPEYGMRWGGKVYAQLLKVEPLRRENADEMLSAMLGRSASLLPLKRLIIETTGGTPFFMEETVQALFDEGALERSGDDVLLLKPLDSLRIPPTVQTILAARIDRLRNEEKMLLQTLAVLGREFVLSLARAVVRRTEDELARLFDNLQLGEFVYEQPSISDVEYIFKHALTQEVAYNSILLERRKQLHEDAGRAIESLYAASLEDHLPALAHHYSRSTNQEKAVKYLSLAGKQAMARGALQQAVQNLESAMSLLKAFPEGQIKDQLELEVLSPLGTAYIATRGYAAPQVGPVFQRARELCNLIGGPQEQFAVVWGNFAWRIVRGEMNLSLELAQEALDRAAAVNDPGVWMEALFLMGVTLFYRGDFTGALKQYETALAHYDDDAERTRLWAVRVGEHAGVTHRCYLALTLWHLGCAEQALAINREMLELARAIDHPFSLAYALHHTSWLFHNMRLPAELLAAADEQLSFAADQGFPLFYATGILYQAGASLLRGEPKAALPLLLRGLDAYRGTGAALALPYYCSLLGNALNGCGRTSEASVALREGLIVAAASEERCHEAELHRLAGDLALSEDTNGNAAENHLRQALGVARKQNSKAWELRATTGLAALYSKQDRHAEAQKMLADCLSGFTEGFDTPDLRDAQALLAGLQTG